MTSTTLKTRQIAAPDVTGTRGHFGCSAASESRVVRVGWSGDGKPPRSAEIDCPVCRSKHRAELSWRDEVDADVERPLDVTLD